MLAVFYEQLLQVAFHHLVLSARSITEIYPPNIQESTNVIFPRDPGQSLQILLAKPQAELGTKHISSLFLSSLQDNSCVHLSFGIKLFNAMSHYIQDKCDSSYNSGSPYPTLLHLLLLLHKIQSGSVYKQKKPKTEIRN